jgi:hypothetical protein
MPRALSAWPRRTSRSLVDDRVRTSGVREPFRSTWVRRLPTQPPTDGNGSGRAVCGTGGMRLWPPSRSRGTSAGRCRNRDGCRAFHSRRRGPHGGRPCGVRDAARALLWHRCVLQQFGPHLLPFSGLCDDLGPTLRVARGRDGKGDGHGGQQDARQHDSRQELESTGGPFERPGTQGESADGLAGGRSVMWQRCLPRFLAGRAVRLAVMPPKARGGRGALSAAGPEASAGAPGGGTRQTESLSSRPWTVSA